MLDVDFDVYDAGAKSELEQLATLLGKPVGQVIRDAVPTLARYLAGYTQPVFGIDTAQPDGGSIKARDLGRRAVRRDLARVYVGAGAASAKLKRKDPRLRKAYGRALSRGNLPEAARLAAIAGVPLQQGEWDGGARHRQLRNSRGRVNANNDPIVIRDKRALDDYRRKKEALVGFAKSGWINAATGIKAAARSVGAWIKNNHGPGVAIDKTADVNSPSVRLINHVRYTTAILTERNRLRAIQTFERSLQKSIQIKTDYLLRREAARAARAAAP